MSLLEDMHATYIAAMISRVVSRCGGLVAVAVALAGAACRDGTAPPVPTSLDAFNTTPTATAGLALAASPAFSVKDAGGRLLGGIPITVTVTAGGGTLASPPTFTLTDAPTPIGTWTLGRTAGLNTVTVTVGTLPPLVISVTGVAGPPTSLAITSGDGQTAFAGTALPAPLTAQLRDQFNNGVSGGSVTFAVAGGGGSISPATLTTDANGNAMGAIWRIGRIAVLQTMTATSGAFTARGTAVVNTNFDVDLRFFGPPMPTEAAAGFTEAAARIRAAVIGDILDLDLPVLTQNQGIDISSCGPTGIVVNEFVDDVIIYATVVSIDGPGGILASAGPCVRRSAATGGYAIVGVMRFDADDIGGLIATNRLNDVILHEMLHVIGFGTNWAPRSLLQGSGGSNPLFSGPLALAACNGAGGSVFCGTGVPVENTGGPGTANAHWRESIFDTELMTGFVEAPGIAMPFSNISIQSLGDTGYIVNAAAADPFLLTGGPVPSRQPRSSIFVGSDGEKWESVVEPMFEISSSGTVRQVKQP